MIKVLFQGDSITDAGRSREADANVGRGYPHLVKAQMGFNEPLKYNFINRGISGNRIVDVYARIKLDIINLAPDFMSILIGVNDVWHEFSRQNGVDADKFEKIYCMLIEEIKQALPDVKLLIIEPFALRGSATEATLEDGSEKYDKFRYETEKRAQAARRVAEKYQLDFMPLQQKLDEMAEKTCPEFWLSDGVHPTEAGHALIAQLWMEKFKEMMA